MRKSWVVVADSSRARFFIADKPAGPLNELKDLTYPEARLHEGDLISDNAGRERNNAHGAHPYSRKDEHKQEAAIRFANQICDELEAGRTAGEFDKLYIVAAPSFLGLLRKCRNGALKKTVAAEIDKDLTTLDPKAIRERLPDFL
ncbi:MAG TPA: host attachment protein [Chromatiales bacterium]|nr:host attachment protein [Chromatiales bacterium]